MQAVNITIRGGKGSYPELVFVSAVFSNSTNLAVTILNCSALKFLFVMEFLENRLRGWNAELLII